jgi:hypothetical protein
MITIFKPSEVQKHARKAIHNNLALQTVVYGSGNWTGTA